MEIQEKENPSVQHHKAFPLLAYCWRFVRPYRLKLFFALSSLVLAAAVILAFGFILRELIDAGINSQNIDYLNKAVLILIGTSLILAAAAYLRTSITSQVAEDVIAAMKKALFNHLLTLDQTFFESIRVGELLSRLSTDTTLIRSLVAASGAVAIRSLIQCVGSIVLLVFTSPKLSGFVAILIPILLLPIIFLGRSVKKYSKLAQEKLGEVNGFADETLAAVSSVQIAGYEKKSLEHFSDLLEESLKAGKKRTQRRSFLISIIIALIFSAISVVLLVGMKDVFLGELSIGQLSSFIFYSVVAAGSMNSLAEVLSDIQAASGAMERILEILVTFPVINDPKMPQTLSSSQKGEIEFKNVIFYYPSRPEVPALKSLNLKIGSGQHIALVGPSGAGKTTIFKLLLRLYDPQQGEIIFDGVKLDQMLLSELRKRIALVPQEPVIFNTTLYENIIFGCENVDDVKFKAAVKASYVEEFCSKLSQGYNTVLGEKGIKLSGGQKQRIAIARAILKDPIILLLDEATNALDSEQEFLVQQALEGIMKNRTTIASAHRLSTVLKAHKIIVLDEGEIVSAGTHQELIAQDGLYSRFAKKQLIA
jgi:ATP-binding cassette subfamily B protein